MPNLAFALLFIDLTHSPLFQIFTDTYNMATQERKLPLGKIEPNSLKYFLSCGFGGIIGMSKLPPSHKAHTNNIIQLVVSKISP